MSFRKDALSCVQFRILQCSSCRLAATGVAGSLIPGVSDVLDG